MKDFEYKSIDEPGAQTLAVIGKAGKFNQYMYQTIRPFCKGNILEIGSGTGNISQYFLDDGASLMLSDFREVYCKDLQLKFKDAPNVTGIKVLDLVDPKFDEKFKGLFNCFDTIFAINVLEHIANDQLAVRNCYKLLQNSGNLVILVPAY